ncbi:AI-2E family transporter [Salinicola aestuarinus]|uniref:AI-2E family transporter n=1 Tax=Salinicola aestuarinus TaxID=1949082 RepID=UPI000DA1A66D|nr:AI-2E family transporter [Salinicola aestuarinus]
MSLKRAVQRWFERYLSDEEAIVLLALLVGGCLLVIWLGQALAPFFTALVVAFLLQGVVTWLERRGLPRLLAVGLVFLLFVGALLALCLIVLPLVWNQLVELVRVAPSMFDSSQRWLGEMQQQYPTIVTPDQIQGWIATAGRQASQLGQQAVTLSLASLGSVMAVIIYLVLVPILVFFLLKDRDRLAAFMLSMLPRKRTLMTRIWLEMDDQIANYVRGKAIEITIVGSVAFTTFWAFGLPYAALLALIVGLSVLVPYIGAAVATLPVAAVAGFHFGMSEQFFYVLVAYAILQALDGNVLVPILFSEAVNLHPVSIIVAVLFFGGIWGFWGIFFAIPLATLIKALVTAWPRGERVVERLETP